VKFFTTTATPLGDMLLVGDGSSDGLALCGAYFIGQRHSVPVDPSWRNEPDAFSEAVVQLTEYFGGERCVFTVPLRWHGTPFQETVWRELLGIPYGATWSYRDLAEKVGHGGKARAVAAAVGRNRLAVFVPCHRVIGADGSLAGYAAGVDRKRWLLEHEGALPRGTDTF